MLRAREYQTRCVDSVVQAMESHNSILCSLFTGAGKTVVFAEIANRFPAAKVLLIVPMRELAWQGISVMERWTDERVGLEMASMRANTEMWWGGNRISVASRQTLLSGSPKRYEKFLGCDIVIVDEAHTQFSDAMLEMLRAFQASGAKVIGMTATPFRMDGKPLTGFYEHVAFDYQLRAGISDGWCVPPRAKLVRCEQIDLKNVSISQGDFSAADLDTVMSLSKVLHQMCLVTQRERVGSTIVFLPGVASAKSFAEMASSQYGLSCGFVCGSTAIQSEEERQRVINDFRQGKIDILSNCQIATMGFDAPIARTVILGRPTKSRSLWLQIVGRVTRPEPGCLDADQCQFDAEARKVAISDSGKPWFKIVDITDASASHSIRTAVDMFAQDNTPKEVLERARRRAEEGDEDPLDLLVQAAEDARTAALIEKGLKAQRGQAEAQLRIRELEIGAPTPKPISEYRVPIKGRYQGKTMGELPDEYITWVLRQPWLQSWQRAYFRRERARRSAVVGHR